MSIHLRRMLCAPEGAEFGSSGGEGVPAAPPPASTTPAPAPAAPPAPRVPFVLPPEEGGPAPAQRPAPGQAPGAPGGQPSQDNPIPHSRVREMIAQAREQARQEALRELQSRPAKPSREQTLAIIRQALELGGIEIPPEAEPPPMTRADIENLFTQYRQETEQRIATQAILAQGQTELAAAKAKYAEHFAAFPELEADVTALWGQLRDKTMAQIVEERVAALDRYVAARGQRYQEQKLQDRRVAPVRPTSAPTGAPARPQHDLATPEGIDAAVDEVLGSEE